MTRRLSLGRYEFEPYKQSAWGRARKVGPASAEPEACATEADGSRPPLQASPSWRRSVRRAWWPWVGLGLLLLSSGCINELDRLKDCQDICSRYGDCFDSTYDVSACRSRCTDDADGSTEFEQLVDQCANCFDDRSCASTVFGCASDCESIVP